MLSAASCDGSRLIGDSALHLCHHLEPVTATAAFLYLFSLSAGQDFAGEGARAGPLCRWGLAGARVVPKTEGLVVTTSWSRATGASPGWGESATGRAAAPTAAGRAAGRHMVTQRSTNALILNMYLICDKSL